MPDGAAAHDLVAPVLSKHTKIMIIIYVILEHNFFPRGDGLLLRPDPQVVRPDVGTFELLKKIIFAS